jgi:hypothetical protein
MNSINENPISPPFMHHCLNMTGGPFHRHFWSSGLQPDFGSPATITARPITGRFFNTVGLRGGRMTSELPWWTVFTSVPEFAPLFPLPRSCLLRYSQLRCHSLVLFWRWSRRRSWNSGLVWVVFKLFFRFPVQLFAIKNFVQRVLAIYRFNLTITQFSTKLI